MARVDKICVFEPASNFSMGAACEVVRSYNRTNYYTDYYESYVFMLAPDPKLANVYNIYCITKTCLNTS